MPKVLSTVYPVNLDRLWCGSESLVNLYLFFVGAQGSMDVDHHSDEFGNAGLVISGSERITENGGECIRGALTGNAVQR